MLIEQITVNNIQSHQCVLRIEDLFLEVTGISGVTVIIQTQTVFIKHDGNLARNMLIILLSQIGYPEINSTTILEKAKSRWNSFYTKYIESIP